MSAAGQAALIWCPFPAVESARAAAEALLDERLVACANLSPQVHSIFVWRGERGEIDECGALFKTTVALLDVAIARLSALHPYEAPAITGWSVQASEQTLAWLAQETRP